jgi:transposase
VIGRHFQVPDRLDLQRLHHNPQLLYLPPYSPDLNPIEMAFAKLKSILRATAARTIDRLWQAIAGALQQFTPDECANYFEAAGYAPA